MRSNNSKQIGFTIIELLVVIVVIGILAAIVIVAYNGVQRNAAVAGLQSDLRNAGTTLETLKVDDDTSSYPGDDDDLRASDGTTFTYSSDGATYCLQADSTILTTPSYYIDSETKTVQEGECGNSFDSITWNVQATDFPGAWRDIAVSDGGTRLIGATSTSSNFVYTSADGGATWTARSLAPSTTRSWSVASSASGQYLAAVAFSEQIRVDFGATWTSLTNGGSTNWYDIQISNDGQVIQAARSSGGISVSTNGGSSFTTYPVKSTSTVVGTAASQDGQYVLANIADRTLYYSTNSGAAWAELTIPNVTFYDMKVSADGTRMAAIGYNSSLDASSNTRRIFTSSDSGASWTERTQLGARFYNELNMSSDGQKLLVRADTSTAGKIFSSTDYGETWTEQTDIGTALWGIMRATSSGAVIYLTQSTTLRVGEYN